MTFEDDEKTVWLEISQKHLTAHELESLRIERNSKNPSSLRNKYPTDDQFRMLFKNLGVVETKYKPTQASNPSNNAPILSKQSISNASTDYLLERIKEIEINVERGQYDEQARELFWSMSEKLTELGITPCDRAHKKFDSLACKNNEIGPATSQYMKDLQTVDQHYVWRWHNGWNTNTELRSGLFAGIFKGLLFNMPQAEKISATRWGTDKKIGIGALDLSVDIQEKLSVLRSDAVRQRQNEQKAKTGRQLNQKMVVENYLRGYAANNPRSRMNTDSIVTYGNVWLAMTIAKGSHTQAAVEYEHLTGNKVSRDFIKDKSKRILDISKSYGWGISWCI